MARICMVKVTRGWSAAKFHNLVLPSADGTKSSNNRLRINRDCFHRCTIASHPLGIVPAPVRARRREIRRGLPFVPGCAGRLSRMAAGMMEVDVLRGRAGED